MEAKSYEARVLEAKGQKRCKDCKEVFSLESFTLVGGGKWRNSYCSDCKSSRDKEYRERDPENYKASLRQRYQESRGHFRNLMRRSLYGVPLGTYEFLLKEQKGRCAVCGGDNACKDNRSFAIDHHHESGVIRGLLCTACNQGIGSFRDDPDLLRAALSYIYKTGYTIQELEDKLSSVEQSPEELGL